MIILLLYYTVSFVRIVHTDLTGKWSTVVLKQNHHRIIISFFSNNTIIKNQIFKIFKYDTLIKDYVLNL